MDPDSMWKFFITIICLFFSALFTASETALTSLNKLRIKQMIESKEKNAERINKLVDDPKRLLCAILIGKYLMNISASSLITSIAIIRFGNKGIGITIGIMTFIILIFGEMVPKSLAAHSYESISSRLSGFVKFFMTILSPFSFLLSKITDSIIRILGGEIDNNQSFITQEEFKSMVNVGYREGVLDDEEKDIIHNVFEFSDTRVEDIMTPRTEMVAIEADTPYEEVLRIISEERYSRIPVYEETKDNIIGILYIKDLLFQQNKIKETGFDLRKIIRQPHFTYESKPTKELFNEMRADRVHMSIVIDEYGGTEGIVTIEDLIEEIVGNIEDEYDKEIKDIEVIGENEYIVNGNVRLDEINEVLGLNIESDYFDTIAGYVIGIIDRIPEEGEEIEYENIKFIIESIDRNRIDKIKILKLERKKETDDEEDNNRED